MSDEPPLIKLELKDRSLLQPYFEMYNGVLSDYTFNNTVLWPGISYAIYKDVMCLFANHIGLSVLLPPIGNGNVPEASLWAINKCKEYNLTLHLTEQNKIEYVSENWLERYGYGYKAKLMDQDYIYLNSDMITLSGSKFGSKRQSKNKFIKTYKNIELLNYLPIYKDECIFLLNTWNQQVKGKQIGENCNLKAEKEYTAILNLLNNYSYFNSIIGCVLKVDNKIIGFSFGEELDNSTFSVLIEKTDKEYNGAAQYIYSEFCKMNSKYKYINAGDSFCITNLANVKESYRPIEKRNKYTLMLF